jgi:hypothetical protein
MYIAGFSQLTETAPYTKDDIVYLLTYDHGGLILWGSEHFQERLRDAVSWLDKYPTFKIGLLSDDLRDSHSPFIHEEKLRFKFFPAMNGNPIGIRDLPFVISETNDKYVEGNYWTALSDGQRPAG